MINREDILKLVNDYTKVGKDFTIKAHEVLHPLIQKASKTWIIGNPYNMETLRFSSEYLHYGQILPRACGKTKFIAEVYNYLKTKGYN